MVQDILEHETSLDTSQGRLLRQALNTHVLLCDGAMGSQVQALPLEVTQDFWDCENCTEVLNLSRPDVVKSIHEAYLLAGADILQTNSFGGSVITLGEFGLEARTFEINEQAARLARETITTLQAQQALPAQSVRPRFVLGSIGPGTKLPSLGHITYNALEDSFYTQALGLLTGGVDGFLIETCQDPLQIKAAIQAVKRAKASDTRFQEVPILVQVTVETTGTLLVGSDIGAIVTILESLDIDSLGLNCATGPEEMREHVQYLSQHWPHWISVQPNAGLPCLLQGKTHYPLTPEAMVSHVQRFIVQEGVNLIGGCCGTTPAHIQALHSMLTHMAENHAPRVGLEAWQRRFEHRPEVKPRSPQRIEGVASLYHSVPFTQENTIFAIGERCNANGSKAFREAQAQEDWDTCVAMAREQAQEGSHALDICVAYVGRDELKDMTTLLDKLRGSSTVPLVIDSTEYPVLEQALSQYGGKAILNSINFEDGEAPAEKRLHLARTHGAAVIALTIDEEGMAKTPESKLAIAQRLRDFACGRFGLPETDLMIDPLTFTICTGNEDDRKLGLWTLEAIEMIHQTMPRVQIILGLSNISFGLKPSARKVLNSVYLHEAVKRGMTGAIIHVSKIVPMHQIPQAQQDAALDLIYDRRDPSQPTTPDNDPLQKFIALFQEETSQAQSTSSRLSAVLEERLKQRIVDGLKKGLEEDLTLALERYSPLDIINTLLLEGMKVVGELFGSGKMQLPFVLQSAETMKLAVKFLEPFMEKAEGQHKGTVVLATVKGDVHDIGKNLVDIILTNNGYRVINLGIKQPIDAILQAAETHQADAIGMSGLLVKSTVIMRENLHYMGEKGLRIPVFLGGAALTQAYVETDCYQAYAPHHQVAYVKDAFESLELMGRIMDGRFQAYLDERQQCYAQAEPSTPRLLLDTLQTSPESLKSTIALQALPTVSMAPTVVIGQHHGQTLTPAPKLPLGVRPTLHWTPDTLLPWLAYERLFINQWGYTPPEGHLPSRGHPEYQGALEAWASKEGLYAHIHRILNHEEVAPTLIPQAVWGAFWVHAEQSQDPASLPAIHWFDNPEPKQGNRLGTWQLPLATELPTPEHLAQWIHPQGEAWVHGCVTLGQPISEVARRWFKEDRYHDYLLLHGLLGELTEALSIALQATIAKAVAQDLGTTAPQKYHRYGAGGVLMPDTALMRDSLTWLQAPERIGVCFNEETHLLTPEESACMLFIPSPHFTRHGW